MKLKAWLREYHNISYKEYKELSDCERENMDFAFRQFNREKQLSGGYRNSNRRPITTEERSRIESLVIKERERYKTNLAIGGIDDRGNYTALSHRWENAGR